MQHSSFKMYLFDFVLLHVGWWGIADQRQTDVLEQRSEVIDVGRRLVYVGVKLDVSS